MVPYSNNILLPGAVNFCQELPEVCHENNLFDRIGFLDGGDDPSFLYTEVFQGTPEPLSRLRRRGRFAFHCDLPFAFGQDEIDIRTGGRLEKGFSSLIRECSLRSMYACKLKL